MAPNRRNFYRMLQVQPDADPAVIKAAYRALIAMHHPDAGGDHAVAALLNEAWSTLSDATRRRAYDAQRAVRAANSAANSAARASASAGRPASASNSADRAACLFCEFPVPRSARSGSRCARCTAPIVPVSAASKTGSGTDRRGLPRLSKSDWALLHVDWRSEGIDVRMRDLSPDGVSVFSGVALPVHRRVRIIGSAFDLVADIVSCHRRNDVYTLHAHLCSAIFVLPTGAYVSATA